MGLSLKSNSLVAFFFLSTFAIQSQIKIPLKIFEGDLKNNDSIYVHRINYFKTKTVDIIGYSSKEGVLELNINAEEGLYYISSNKVKSSAKLFFEKNPKIYHYSMCSKFYKDENYIFISSGEFNYTEFKYLKKFYTEFGTKSFDDKLYDDEGNQKTFSLEKAKKIINDVKQDYLFELEKNQSSFSKEFTNYIKTEIQLGAINQLVNWYEEIYSEEIQANISHNKRPNLFKEISSYYNSNHWSTYSVQYYRLTERLVNIQCSYNKGIYKAYHDNEKEKDKIRKSNFYQQYYE